MFEVGKEYFTNRGLKVRIVSNSAGLMLTPKGPLCNVIGIQHNTNGSQAVYHCSDNGAYMGVNPTSSSYLPFCLISDEPNAEEAALIQEIGDLVEGGVKDREAAMLKIIRKLRTK